MSRRAEVQRCPWVPTLANKVLRTTMSKSASPKTESEFCRFEFAQ